MKLVWICNILVSFCVYSQDEALYNKIFKNNKLQQGQVKNQKTKLELKSKDYAIDLNEDLRNEYIQVAKKDGIDYLYVKDTSKKIILEKKIIASGLRSGIFKIKLVSLSKDCKVLIVFFNNGYTGVENYLKTARLFFISIDNNKLNKLHFYKGPSIFREEDKKFMSYSLRRYGVTIFDYNNDGVSEISVKLNSINKVFFYKGQGDWAFL